MNDREAIAADAREKMENIRLVEESLYLMEGSLTTPYG